MGILSENEIRDYHKNGFAAVKGLVSSEEIDRLKQDALNICRGMYPSPAIKAAPTTMSDKDVLENFLAIHQAHKISPFMMDMVKHAGISTVLSEIIAPNIKCMQSMLFIKPPGFPGQAWHQDELYIPTRDRSLTGAWIAIDDATVMNGCLWVVPGSHIDGYLYQQESIESMQDEWDFSPCSVGFDDGAKMPVEVEAGSVVFFNGYLLHSSYRNQSQIYRRVLVSHYMNAMSLLPWQDSKDYRDVVIVAGHDPYEYKGYEHRNDVYLRPCKKLAEKMK